MRIESKNSVLALIKQVAELNTQELAITKREYEMLIEELWNLDEYLKGRYIHHSQIPKIYSLYGVKLKIT